jgi:hypothetical protein
MLFGMGVVYVMVSNWAWFQQFRAIFVKFA